MDFFREVFEDFVRFISYFDTFIYIKRHNSQLYLKYYNLLQYFYKLCQKILSNLMFIVQKYFIYIGNNYTVLTKSHIISLKTKILKIIIFYRF